MYAPIYVRRTILAVAVQPYNFNHFTCEDYLLYRTIRIPYSYNYNILLRRHDSVFLIYVTATIFKRT
jgi:hypothetical protein